MSIRNSNHFNTQRFDRSVILVHYSRGDISVMLFEEEAFRKNDDDDFPRPRNRTRVADAKLCK
jgi:hypothetical protein